MVASAFFICYRYIAVCLRGRYILKNSQEFPQRLNVKNEREVNRHLSKKQND